MKKKHAGFLMLHDKIYMLRVYAEYLRTCKKHDKTCKLL